MWTEDDQDEEDRRHFLVVGASVTHPQLRIALFTTEDEARRGELTQAQMRRGLVVCAGRALRTWLKTAIIDGYPLEDVADFLDEAMLAETYPDRASVVADWYAACDRTCEEFINPEGTWALSVTESAVRRKVLIDANYYVLNYGLDPTPLLDVQHYWLEIDDLPWPPGAEDDDEDEYPFAVGWLDEQEWREYWSAFRPDT